MAVALKFADGFTRFWPSTIGLAVPGEPEPKDPGRDHRRIDDSPQEPPLHHLERFRLDGALLGGTMVNKQARQIGRREFRDAFGRV